MFRNYLLPNLFKWIGIGLFALSFFIGFYAEKFEIDKIQKENILSIAILLGFVLIRYSKEKHEDERTKICRYKASSKSLNFIILFTLFYKLQHLLNPNPDKYEMYFLNTGVPTWFICLAAFVYYSHFRSYLRNEAF